MNRTKLESDIMHISVKPEDIDSPEAILHFCDEYPSSGQNRAAAKLIRKLMAAAPSAPLVAVSDNCALYRAMLDDGIILAGQVAPQATVEPLTIAEAICQGRAEAVAIILGLSAEGGLDEYSDSVPFADTGDYDSVWNEAKLHELFRTRDTVWSKLQETTGEFYRYAGLADQMEERLSATHPTTGPSPSDILLADRIQNFADWLAPIQKAVVAVASAWCDQCATEIEAAFDGAAAAVSDATPPTSKATRCPNCDDTGDVHNQTGEWRGTCDCRATSKADTGEVMGQYGDVTGTFADKTGRYYLPKQSVPACALLSRWLSFGIASDAADPIKLARHLISDTKAFLAPTHCTHPSWKAAENGKHECEVCGGLGMELRYLSIESATPSTIKEEPTKVFGPGCCENPENCPKHAQGHCVFPTGEQL
jgi:hypothetical protein